MAKIEDKDFLAECERIAKLKDWSVKNWDAEDTVIAIIRTAFRKGDPELLKDEHKDYRDEVVAACKCSITAAVNFQRDYLAAMKLCPEKPSKKASAKKEYS